MNTASQSSRISYNSKNEEHDVSQDEIREVELKIEENLVSMKRKFHKKKLRNGKSVTRRKGGDR
jgi:siroheme synthase